MKGDVTPEGSGSSAGGGSTSWEIVITDWALDAYLNLKHAGVFADHEYWTVLRPDVELLRAGIPSPHPKFKNPKVRLPRPAVIPFKTTPEQIMRLAEIMTAMKKAKLDEAFIVAASELARTDQGVFDLMDLWSRAAGDRAERDEIVADLQDAIDEEADAPAAPLKKPYIKFDKLDLVVQKVVEDKERLRQLVERHGGVSAVARRAGIPQPSLSRMLSSASMPRRSTLYKIANALDLSEVDIVTEWSR